MIIALKIISASEIAKVIPNFTYDWVENNRHLFQDMLFDLGLDISQEIEEQLDLVHRNHFNEIVQCTRWVGYERTDYLWIHSGYASDEAKDKALGSKLLEDIYKTKGYTA